MRVSDRFHGPAVLPLGLAECGALLVSKLVRTPRPLYLLGKSFRYLLDWIRLWFGPRAGLDTVE
jgi:hypothetical protein